MTNPKGAGGGGGGGLASFTATTATVHLASLLSNLFSFPEMRRECRGLNHTKLDGCPQQCVDGTSKGSLILKI